MTTFSAVSRLFVQTVSDEWRKLDLSILLKEN